jgi:hypothetical protein
MCSYKTKFNGCKSGSSSALSLIHGLNCANITLVPFTMDHFGCLGYFTYCLLFSRSPQPGFLPSSGCFSSPSFQSHSSSGIPCILLCTQIRLTISLARCHTCLESHCPPVTLFTSLSCSLAPSMLFLMPIAKLHLRPCFMPRPLLTPLTSVWPAVPLSRLVCHPLGIFPQTSL